MAPLYITQFLSQKNMLRKLMCNDQHLLEIVLLTALKYAGDRSFQKAAPM